MYISSQLSHFLLYFLLLFSQRSCETIFPNGNRQELANIPAGLEYEIRLVRSCTVSALFPEISELASTKGQAPRMLLGPQKPQTQHTWGSRGALEGSDPSPGPARPACSGPAPRPPHLLLSFKPIFLHQCRCSPWTCWRRGRPLGLGAGGLIASGPAMPRAQLLGQVPPRPLWFPPQWHPAGTVTRSNPMKPSESVPSCQPTCF